MIECERCYPPHSHPTHKHTHTPPSYLTLPNAYRQTHTIHTPRYSTTHTAQQHHPNTPHPLHPHTPDAMVALGLNVEVVDVTDEKVFNTAVEVIAVDGTLLGHVDNIRTMAKVGAPADAHTPLILQRVRAYFSEHFGMEFPVEEEEGEEEEDTENAPEAQNIIAAASTSKAAPLGASNVVPVVEAPPAQKAESVSIPAAPASYSFSLDEDF